MEIDDRDSIMPNKSFNDLSAITLRRDQELVDIKLKFQEQIDNLKAQLKKEQQTNQKFLNFISQKTNTYHT